MEKNLDNVLKHALTPTEEPDFWLNQRIMNGVKEQESMKRSRKRVSVAVLVAAVVLCLSSVTVVAAWKYLSPADVAGIVQDERLAEIFLSEQALVINETQEFGGYQVTLLSMVSGEMLSDYNFVMEDGEIRADRTYVVVAIENADGTPLPDTYEEACGEKEFFASPLLAGYAPSVYNMASMGGGYAEISEKGIFYRLLECDNVEIFADRELYLCVNEGMFYKPEAYVFDEATGNISRNREYEGLNALFTLPIDDTKANPTKAAEYIAGLGLENDINEEKLNVEWQSTGLNEQKLEFTNDFEETTDAIGDVETEFDQGVEVIEYALQFVGNPYVWGGDSLTEGTDSSGFVKSVYAQFEIALPHSSTEQRKLGVAVEDLEKAGVGDLIFYDTPAHVAIYIGEGKVIHAMSQIGICVSEADFDEIAEIRRVFAEDL